MLKFYETHSENESKKVLCNIESLEKLSEIIFGESDEVPDQIFGLACNLFDKKIELYNKESKAQVFREFLPSDPDYNLKDKCISLWVSELDNKTHYDLLVKPCELYFCNNDYLISNFNNLDYS